MPRKDGPLTSVARTYPARATQDTHSNMPKCITTSWSGPAAGTEWHNTIDNHYRTIWCYYTNTTLGHCTARSDMRRLFQFVVNWAALGASFTTLGSRRARLAANFVDVGLPFASVVARWSMKLVKSARTPIYCVCHLHKTFVCILNSL